MNADMSGHQQSKKYLVVGANSFLAREIIFKLKDENDVTCIYHTNKDKLLNELISVRDTEMEKLDDCYDVIFIISAYIPGSGESADEKLLKEVNVSLPERICRQFRSAKIVFASSVSVYGDTTGAKDENSLCVNPSPYGSSKLQGEVVISNHFRHNIIRISSMYGIGMNLSTFIPHVIQSAIKMKKIRLFGDGSRRQNYIHVRDVAEFFVRAAMSEKNGIFLSCAETSYSNKEIAIEVQDLIPETEIEYVGEDFSNSNQYSANQSYQLLGYKPQINIHQGIAELIQWQQKMYW